MVDMTKTHIAKRIGLALMSVLLLGISLSACAEGAKPPSVLQPPPVAVPQGVTLKVYDLNVVKTIGDHSYIPINIDGTPDSHADTILNILSVFKTSNPELEITGWKIEKNQSAYTTGPYIYGLWIDHKPAR